MNFFRYLIAVFLFWASIVHSQIGDNGYPFLNNKLFIESNYNTREQYRDSQGNYVPLSFLKDKINSFELDGYNSQDIKNEILQLPEKDSIFINQNIYGKAYHEEIDISNNTNRIEYGGRYFHLFKISSLDAKALQIYFKKYYLPADSKLFFYSENGFILGEFNEKNNPQVGSDGLEFGTQPIPGNNFYIELSYPVSSSEKPILITEKVIFSVTDFYSGAYGEAGNCHKNVACVFTGNDDKSRNIKSVGLMLYPIYQNGVNQHTYSATCSGNLMNNTKQDGTPYFLTAAHCIGYDAANNNINWSNELITLFNYEAKTCASNGSDAPSALSNNSVLGCTLLTQSPFNANDYALLKLNGTENNLAQYKVCYAGWDNNPNSYVLNVTNTYGIHHPKGDTKKISLIKNLYPVTTNQDIPFVPQNPQGAFLKTTWRDGIVEKGSSGSPLFNSFDRLIGSLSTGPDPNYFNCSNPEIYSNIWFTHYSRFSNNYYTMSPWLNPDGINVQSIGPYCPSTPIQIGAPISVILNPGGSVNPGGPPENVPIDINGNSIHPSNTWGKKIYLRGNRNYTPENINVPNTNFYYVNQATMVSDDLFAASTNIYRTGSQQVVDQFELWGIYKIIGCNKLKYIKPAPITIRNPVTMPGQLNEVIVDIVGITNDKVHLLIYSSKRNNDTAYFSYELQTYKVVNNELVYLAYYPVATNLQPPFNGYSRFTEYNKNRILLGRKEGSQRIFNSYFFNETNNTWSVSPNALTFPEFSVIKMIDDKIFILPSPIINSGYENKLHIYAFSSGSPNVTLQTLLNNIFLSNPTGIYDISKKLNNEYWIIYNRDYGSNNFALMSLNLSNNSASHFQVSDYFKYVTGASQFIIRNNEIVRITELIVSSPSGEFPTHQYVSFINTNGTWVENKTTFFKWQNVAGYNNNYLLSLDIVKPGAIGNFSTLDRTLSIKEFDYMIHPYIIYDSNSSYYSGAYHRPNKIDHSLFDVGTIDGKTVYKNLIFSNTNNFPIGYGYGGIYTNSYGYSYNYNTRTYDIKTVILDNKTESITGNKNVYVYGKYSVVMKPGFSVSSSSGTEFHAIPQESLPSDIPACSFMFDDMLDPKITETPNETIYLKQGSFTPQNPTYFGEIVLNEDKEMDQKVLDDKNVKIYPNPTKDLLYIDLNGKSQDFVNLYIFSADGKKLITKEILLNNFEISLLQYPTGVYILTLTGKKGKSYSYKVIKK